MGPHPVGRIVLHLLNRLEQVMTEPVVADCPVVAFDISVLLRVSRLDVVQPDASALCPSDEGATDVFRAVIAANELRFVTPLDDLIQCPHHSL